MKKPHLLLALTIFLMVLLLGCKLGGASVTPPAGPTPLPAQGNSPAPTAAPTAEASAITSQGSGDFDLENTLVGLDGLHSYRQSLQTAFDGTINGELQQSKTVLTWEFMDDPSMLLTWIDMGGQPVQFFGRIGSVNYHQPSLESACSAMAIDSAGSQQASSPYPLASLPPVRGAEFTNEEDVNGVPAKHYTFDERAIGYAGQAAAQGEVWVASSGGYVVRYTLRLEAPADLLGPGVEGEQTWNYELSEVNTGKIDLPEVCQQLQENVTVPLLDNATVLLQQPGYLVYQAASGVDAALAFYQQQAQALGWSGGSPYQFGEVTRVTLRPADGSLVQLTFEPAGDLLTVTVQTLAPIPAEYP